MERLNNVDELKNLRERMKGSSLNADTNRVRICCGTACSAQGSHKIVQAFEEESALKDMGIEVVKTGCQGLCQKGPVMRTEPYDYFYQRVTYERVREIISKTFSAGVPVRRLLYRESAVDGPIEKMEDLPFYKKQVRIVLRNNGFIDPCNIYHYIAAGGYAALEKVLSSMTPEQVLEEVEKSNLRGRGGAGFPTGKKWEHCKKSAGRIKFVIANGDEGDPGAFMDRSVMEGDPHSLIEGMLISAYTLNAEYGFIYVRHEYPLAVKNLKMAIRQAQDLALLGDDILGTNIKFHLDIREGAGAFVCGEETALMRSIEGYRGMPTPRPPFPAIKGLWDNPTVINNVETLAQIPYIILKGADHYRSIGTEKSSGTKVFALTGKVVNTGLIEVPMGITLKEIIYDIGGGIRNNRRFKAVQTGGPSGGCLSEEQLDLPVDYDSLTNVGSMMGSGGIVVLDEDNCMVDIAKFFLSFTGKESCGKCPPCRVGTDQMLQILERITSGNGEEGDIERLEKIGNLVKAGSLCGLGQTAPNPVLSTIRYFRDEYEEHIKDKFCRARVCKGLGVYRIDGAECFSCGLCKKACAFNAVKETKEGFYIDRDSCTKCKACYLVCPIGAVKIGSRVIPWVVPEQCEGCSDCVHACPVQGLKMYKTENEGIFIPWLSDPDACVSCGKCAAVCASSGIAMTTHVESAKQRFSTKKPKGLVADEEKRNCGAIEATSNTEESVPESKP
jgi:NADH:ubiquinone oxidoreductase subunit F (NADH-binding)/NAD-dependent dihydropyrimidine dehydrogenase PreA subunit/(2Fe-2S) ferredoxin